jgi:hypothetical protein
MVGVSQGSFQTNLSPSDVYYPLTRLTYMKDSYCVLYRDLIEEIPVPMRGRVEKFGRRQSRVQDTQGGA